MKRQHLVLVIITSILITWLPCQADDASYGSSRNNIEMVQLGSIEGTINGGQVTSYVIPKGIYFGYGYSHDPDPSINQVYIFDDIVIPEIGITIDLSSKDAFQFNEVVDAIENWPPPASAFFIALGFYPSDPFLKWSVAYPSSPITIPQNSRITFLRLTIDPFTIISTPLPDNGTLWEVPDVHYNITAFGVQQ